MKYVYLLRSESNEKQTYVGFTTDFQKLPQQHNTGESPCTGRFRPWKPVVVVLRFDDDQKAEQFEHLLKSGSGHAFAKRHFW